MLRTIPALLVVSIAFAGIATSTALADTVYVGYYHSNDVGAYTVNASGAVTGGSVFATGVTPEGFGCLMGAPGGAPKSELFVADPTSGHVALYNAANGALINSQFMSGPGGAAITGLAGTALSADGHELYVTQQTSGNVGTIYEFNTLTGQLLHSISFAGAHDVAIGPGGFLYASAYESTTASSQGVWRFNSDLSGATQIIAPTAGNNLFHPSGLAFNGNTLFVGNPAINTGNGTGPSFVEQFTIAGTSATLVNTFNNPTTGATQNFLLNPFGMTFHNGELYVSSLGDINTIPGQVTELDPTTGKLSTFISSGEFINGTASVAPKYVTFESDCTMYSAVPEPSSFVLIGVGLGAAGLSRLRSRRRAA
jgi:hypothetical protein